MSVVIRQELLEPCRVLLTVEVPAEYVRRVRGSVLARALRGLSVPGFRKGKVPPNLARRLIDEAKVDEQTRDEVVRTTLTEALKQVESPYTDGLVPSVEVQGSVDVDEGVVYRVEIPLAPRVELGSLEGFTARRVRVTVSEEEVDAALTELADELAAWEQVDDGAVVGDRARLTIEISVDGAPDPEAGFSKPTLVQIGANLETLDAGLIGIRRGEERSFEFEYPADFHDPARAARRASARAVCSEVLRKRVPALDDQFARSVGAANLADLRESLRSIRQSVADHASESEFQRLLIDEAVARSRVLFPREMLDRRIAEHTRAFMELLDQRKINLEQFLGSTRQDLTTLESEIARVAEEALKRSLVLSELLAHHKIRISMEDVEQYVDQLAEVEGMKRTRMRRRLEEDGRMGRFLDVQFTKQLCEVLEKQVQVREVTA